MVKKENKREKTKEEMAEDIETFICHKGWSDRVEHALDILFMNFQVFGWRYGFLDKEITREELKDNLYHLIEYSKQEKCRVGSGRISVDVTEDELDISLDL